SIGILEDAIVNLSDKKATCIYNISGKRWIAQVPLSDLELAAYNRHPETFFGVKTKVQREIKDAIGFFEWFYDVYKNTPTENLLEFSVQYPQIEQIKKMSREEILLHLCEMYAWWAMSQ
ncbi:MAG: hypothetical protein LBL47_02970, partial [Lactobacillus sp.]|nr:hypothetical protein [Lactobacillus sp.]